MSFNTEEDDDFGLPSSNSKLSSLFRDTLSLPSDNKALTYTAPKRPGIQQKQQVQQISSTTEQEVLTAAVVTCYKLNNQKYEALQGKVGLALLGNHEKHYYSIVLYLNKQKPLSTTSITKNFKLISQPDNFCTFFDDSRKNWAVLFDTLEATEKFASEVKKVLMLLNGGPITNKEMIRHLSKESEVASDSPDNAEESSKTKLISRMAKLGQPILPLKGAAVAEENGSDTAASLTETEEEKLENVKPQKPSRPEKSPQKQLPQPVNDGTLLNSFLLPASNYSFVGGLQSVPMLPYPGQSSPFTAAPPTGSFVNYYETLLSETRTQNSEIRMHLCRLMDKIDHLAQRKESSSSNFSELKLNFDKLLGQSSQQTEQLAELLNRVTISTTADSTEEIKKSIHKECPSNTFSAESESSNSTIKKLKEENDQLASLLHNKIQEQNIILLKFKQLEDENVKLRDDSNNSISYHSELRKNAFEEEIEKLQIFLQEQKFEKEKLAELHENELRYLKEELTNNADTVKSLRNELEEKLHEIENGSQENSLKERALSQANQQVDNLKNELTRVRAEMSNRSESGLKATDQVKTIMNKIYKEITKQFKPKESYFFDEIKSTVGAVIRDTTLQMLIDETDKTANVQGIQKPIDSKSVNSNAEKTDGASNKAEELCDHNQLLGSEPLPGPKETDVAKKAPENPHLDAGLIEKTDNATQDEMFDKQSNCTLHQEVSLTDTSQHSTDDEDETKGRTESFEETLQTSLGAAYIRGDPVWKPAPPPLPPIRDFNDDDQDDWLP